MFDATLDARVNQIAEKLKTAIEARLQPVGSEDDGFRLNSPLSEVQVASFEACHGIRLPEGYRAFITKLADGGAGPAYGMYSLNKAATKDIPVPLDYLRTPFPHVGYYRPSLDPAVDALWARVERGEIPEEEVKHQVLYRTAGTLDLCNEGCGILHFLVITGPTRGQMWINAEDSDQGYAPLGVDFLEWYERWLDGTLEGGEGLWWLDTHD